MKKGLIIFVKNPVLGKTKTRIAKTLGDQKALEIYLQLSAYTRAVCKQIDVKRYVFYSDQIEPNDLWDPNLFDKYLQTGDDLGSRMHNAFETAFKDCDQVCIIGSDCLAIDPMTIKEAFIKLDSHKAVIGPSKDGGYYLLGMTQIKKTLFENIQWSQSTVLSDTISKIETLGWSYELLDQLRDIDHEQDWNEQKHMLEENNRPQAADYIFHVADLNQWNAQMEKPQFVVESLKEEGFIHCCYEHQFEHVLSNYFTKDQNLKILKLDPTLFFEHFKIEKAGNKGMFPHIYAPISKNWIMDIQALKNPY